MLKKIGSKNINYKQGFSFTNPTKPDEHYNNVVCYLNFSGVDNGTSFTDLSNYNHTVNRLGSSPPVTSTTQVKTGLASGFFGESLSYLSINHADLALGTSNFTVEFWGYKTVITNDGALSIGTSNTNFTTVVATAFSGTLYTIGNTSTGDTFPLNQWNHVAIVREGTGTNLTKTYLNGTLIHTQTFGTNITGTFYNIGIYSGTSFCWDGYIDSFRVTKGVARYTANFNAETDTSLRY